MSKLTFLFKYICSYFPSKLPTGMTEFNKWLDDVVELTGPIATERDMHFVLCSILIHADVKHGALPKRYFVTRLIKSAANQVASQVFQDIKLAQAEEQAAKKAELEALSKLTIVEATTPNESAVANATQKANN